MFNSITRRTYSIFVKLNKHKIKEGIQISHVLDVLRVKTVKERKRKNKREMGQKPLALLLEEAY